MISIGKLQFPSPLFMAPMEGITDVPFRRMVRKHGCGVICTQMIHAEGLLRGSGDRLKETSTLDPLERPVGFQLCGSNPSVIGEAAKKAQDMGAAFIDINMGCPAQNVVKVGSGAALLKTPDLAAEVVRETVASVSIPVTVKIRAGWDDQYRNATEVAQLLETAGASLVTVHARTKAQRFKGKADWNLVRTIKEKVSIPVVGNGDVFAPEDIDQMMQETGADGVMLARGALGNPWLFSKRLPTVGEIREGLLEHLDLHLGFYPRVEGALITFRKHIVWYTKGLADAAEFRRSMFKQHSLPVTLDMLNHFFDRFDPNAFPSSHHVD